MKREQNGRAPESTIVIFGASGDLAKRKLLPALFRLYQQKKMAEKWRILGVSRTNFTDTTYQEAVKEDLRSAIQASSAELENFCAHVFYLSIDPTNASEMATLPYKLAELNASENIHGNILFHLATPPDLYNDIATALAAHGLNEEKAGWRRLIVENPFCSDLKSAQLLDKHLHDFFQESQLYRIDHYLGKETVQNLLVIRFANSIFEPLWNASMVDYVEITASESLGVEKRGGYYDRAGAVRDMLQNHLLQVLAMVAMEPPPDIRADYLRDEVVKVMRFLRPFGNNELANNLVLGQYLASKIRGEQLLGYREEPGVEKSSRTDTYVALKIFIDNWRWAGVPFYVRTGKRLPTRVSEVVIHFKKTPHPFFAANTPDNMLILRIQPDEGVLVKFGLKQPGVGFVSKEVSMDFHYQDLGGMKVPDAYDRLLLDALHGDSTLFARSDEVEASWTFVQPILDYVGEANHQLYGYAAGTWGPQEADELLIRDGRRWRFPCANLTATEYCEL